MSLPSDKARQMAYAIGRLAHQIADAGPDERVKVTRNKRLIRKAAEDLIEIVLADRESRLAEPSGAPTTGGHE